MFEATENLKSLRLIYGVLMTLSTAIFVFVLTPDDSSKYKGALTELATLSQLNGSKYYAFAHKRLQEFEGKENLRLLSAARKAGLSIPKPVRYALPAIVDRPPDNNNLFQCDAFFSGTQVLAPILIDSTDEDLIKRIRDEASRQNVAGERLVVVQLRDPGGVTEASGGTMLSADYSGDGHWRGIIEFVFEGDSPVMAPKTVQIAVVLVKGVAHSGPLGLEWLRQDLIGRNLIDWKTGVVFPHLKPFWNQFGIPMRADTVAAYLQQQLQSLKGGTVSFFGISINGALMVAVGPVVCFITLLYFQLVFNRFVLMANFEDESIRRFPWVPLFPGPLAQTVTYGSLCFPFLTNFWLVSKYGVWTEMRTWMGVGGLILLAAVAIWAFLDFSSFHAKLRLCGQE